MKEAIVYKDRTGYWATKDRDTGMRIGGLCNTELEALKAANAAGYTVTWYQRITVTGERKGSEMSLEYQTVIKPQLEATNRDERTESGAAAGYARPRTRGELRDLLNAGVACEVVSSVAQMTAAMLMGWLDFLGFIVRPSEHAGWSVFEKA